MLVEIQLNPTCQFLGIGPVYINKVVTCKTQHGVLILVHQLMQIGPRTHLVLVAGIERIENVLRQRDVERPVDRKIKIDVVRLMAKRPHGEFFRRGRNVLESRDSHQVILSAVMPNVALIVASVTPLALSCRTFTEPAAGTHPE